MAEQLTAAADLAWRIAALEARRLRSAQLSPDHLLIGLLSLDKLLDPAAGLAPEQREAARPEQETLARLLAQVGLDAVTLRRAIRDEIPAGSAWTDAPTHRDADCRAIFERAAALARAGGNASCGALHLLTAALDRPQSEIPRASRGGPTGLRGDCERLLERVQAAIAPARSRDTPRTTPDLMPPPPDPPPLERTTPPPDPQPTVPPPPEPTPAPPRWSVREPLAGPSATAVPAVLLRFGRDLTAEAEAGALGTVVGRRAEMLQVVRVLHRRTKNSPVLIGEAGVGKTAVVEGLARQIVEGTVLPGRRIVALSLASVLAGAAYRGQFEERLEEVLAALRSRPDVILFLDELHTIVGAGDRDGRLDAANIMKPALARGEIACIGATTVDEYRRHIEPDAALERRFQPVLVAEPSAAEALAMLDGLRAELERHHGVTIEPDALHAAVELTVRYVTGRRLPDKAVDALDEACARASVPTLTPGPASNGLGARAGLVVTRETVAAVVSSWTGLPLGQIGQHEAARLADLETQLAGRIVGQPEAIAQVARRVRMARTGLTDPERPASVFLFLGPSGVGKTELARALAEMAWEGVGGPAPLIRLDMSEYGEKHDAARLIGAPPGYLGHEEEGQLTGALRRQPRAVVLLDEAEKAHPEVFDLFLQLFDAGRLTDARGRLVDGRQAIFILTSNLVVSGAGRRALGFEPARRRQAGRAPARDEAGTSGTGRDVLAGAGIEGGSASPAADRAALRSELRAFFRPELLDRIDEIVLFRPLGEAALLEIVRRRLAALRERLLAQHAVTLRVTPEAEAFLVQQAAAESGGARGVHRVVSRLVEEPLSRALVDGRLISGDRLTVELRDESLALIPASCSDRR